MAYRLDGHQHDPRFYQTGRFAAFMFLAIVVGAVIAGVLALGAEDDKNTSYLYLGEAPRFGDGIWRVEDQARPGTYNNEGALDSCEWARVSAMTLDPAAEIESGAGAEVHFVFIDRGDFAFKTRNCGIWERIQ